MKQLMHIMTAKNDVKEIQTIKDTDNIPLETDK
jgi:hypothetical protein